MITGLFETHINVVDLERSAAFYCDRLGLQVGFRDEARRIVFLWLGRPGEAMLGLWEKPLEQVQPQHFAFRASADDIEHRAVAWLRQRELTGFNFLADGTERPMVFAWMPALAIYFLDPDGHTLELISMLPGQPRAELGVVSYDQWREISSQDR